MVFLLESFEAERVEVIPKRSRLDLPLPRPTVTLPRLVLSLSPVRSVRVRRVRGKEKLIPGFSADLYLLRGQGGRAAAAGGGGGVGGREEEGD